MDKNSPIYWEKFLNSYKPDLSLPDDVFALETCKLALQAVKLGNFGVGSLIVDDRNQIIVHGHNEVLYPYFRSARHGEMVVMERFEEQFTHVQSMDSYIFYTSLEPCPMCMTRLITSGCKKIVHVANDPWGGMVHLQHHLPPIWKELAKRQQFVQAQCSQDLIDAAQNIFILNAEHLNQVLLNRGQGDYSLSSPKDIF